MAKNEEKSKMRDKKAKEKKLARERKRNRVTTALLRPLVSMVMLPRMSAKVTEKPQLDSNCLLLVNHNTNMDFILVGSTFKQTIYYVLSEHVMQKGIASKLLKYFFSPIARTKGTTASSTAMSVLRTLKRGDTVCIFAEGNRSFNGETCPILFSTGKLARASGAPLVTYKLIGGYFISPRWSYTLRKGSMRGEIVNIYSPEQLRAMTDDEINEAIKADLYEDAYARQAQEHIEYKGKKLAEGLEHALFMCPQCGAIGEMHSKGDKLSCKCGMSVRFDSYGKLSGSRYDTVAEWDKWQKASLREIIDKGGEEALFSDANAILYTIDDKHIRREALRGELAMTCSELRIGDKVFALDELSGLAIYGRCTMVFEHDGTHYEIGSKERLNAVKYVEAFTYIREKKEQAELSQKDEALA